MSAELLDRVDWSGSRDKDGYEDFNVKWLVKTTDQDEGPGTVMDCPGAPAIGSTWNIGNEIRLFVYCWPDFKVSRALDKPNEPGYFWHLDQHFTNRPLKRCQDTPIENPLDEPPDLRGGFSKRTIQGSRNKEQALIVSSTDEPLTGKELEFEDNRPTVAVGINILLLPLSEFSEMIDHVSDGEMWGLPKRCVKLSNASWQRKLYGTCNYYFTVNYEFDVNSKTFDRIVADRGIRCLRGHSPKSYYRDNPLDQNLTQAGLPISHFEEFQELYLGEDGQNHSTWLNGKGVPTDAANAAQIKVEYYPEANLFDLGVPADFNA